VILWVGEADWWNGGRPMPAPDEVRFVFPLVEETTGDVARMTTSARKIDERAWYKATHRGAMRRALPSDLNPDWWTDGPEGRGAVMKQARSTYGRGVHVDPEAVVCEAYIPGPQWEQNGVVLGGHTYFFRTLKQLWDEREHPRIRLYQIAEAPGFLHSACIRALATLGVDDSPFCIELRQQHGTWRVIEINTRLGEDPCHPFLLWPTHPLRQVERWVEELT
jgi:hypothetical protein